MRLTRVDVRIGVSLRGSLARERRSSGVEGEKVGWESNERRMWEGFGRIWFRGDFVGLLAAGEYRDGGNKQSGSQVVWCRREIGVTRRARKWASEKSCSPPSSCLPVSQWGHPRLDSRVGWDSPRSFLLPSFSWKNLTPASLSSRFANGGSAQHHHGPAPASRRYR